MERFSQCRKPLIGCFLGTDGDLVGAAAPFRQARTIDQAVQLAIASLTGEPAPSLAALSPEEREWAEQERRSWAAEQRYLWGLFAGGTLCYQSQQILQEAGIAAHSNTPLNPNYRLAHPDRSRQHTLVDMGNEYYTLGKPHPMIDGTLRKHRILSESRDPQVAVLLLDFILGYGASRDPVGELFDAIVEARHAVQRRGGRLTVVASICGTERDVQDLGLQTRMLQEAGAIVLGSGAKAALFCCALLKGA